LLFSQTIPSQDLGFVDSKASSIDITIGGRDLTIYQSPTILSSSRQGGTTGAVVWKVTPSFAEWISSPDNLLFKQGVLSGASSVIELGCGINGIIGLTLAPLVGNYILTDQEYVRKHLEQNLLENAAPSGQPHISGSRVKRGSTKNKPQQINSNIVFNALDWETDDVSSLASSSSGEVDGFDAIIACDCIYNDALVDPFVTMCRDICRLRLNATRARLDGSESQTRPPSVCVIAQQLRSDEVFEAWLTAFHTAFHVWRLPDEYLTRDLASNSGFVVHVGILR
jgi:hypothetical protein